MHCNIIINRYETVSNKTDHLLVSLQRLRNNGRKNDQGRNSQLIKYNLPSNTTVTSKEIKETIRNCITNSNDDYRSPRVPKAQQRKRMKTIKRYETVSPIEQNAKRNNKNQIKSDTKLYHPSSNNYSASKTAD
jgi:hypothetical protein